MSEAQTVTIDGVEVEVDPLHCKMNLSLSYYKAIMYRQAGLVHERDEVYKERNLCVMSFAYMAKEVGWNCGIGKHVGEEWDDEWRNVIFVETPLGQVSWHIHDKELPLFHFLGVYRGGWDGHSTEEKYERLKALTRFSE